MSYSSKTYSSGNTLYADDMNNLVSGIDDLYDRVAAIDGQGTPSSGENIEYTLSQGYVSKTDDNNVNTTRVKTNFIYGSFSVKVNDGYVIRAIYTYPTDSVSSSYTEILSNSLDCTSYDLKNEGAYAVLTFAKASDPTASLSPTEDIIMSLTTYVEQKPDTAAGCLYINRAVFFGDSITHGVYSYFEDDGSGNKLRKNGFDTTDTGHPRIPAYFGELAGATVTNHGKRGSGWIVDTRNIGNAWEMTQQTDFSQYDFAAYCLGINDGIQGAALGSLEEPGTTGGAIGQGTVVGSMIACFEKVFTDNPLCKVVVYSPYNTWGQYSQGGDYTSDTLYGDESTNYALGAKNKAGYTLQELIDLIDKVCKYYGIRHVPLSQSNVCNRFTIKDIMI